MHLYRGWSGGCQAGDLDVGFDGGGDVEGESEGGAAVFAGDYWSRASADGVEEGFDFEAEGFALFYFGLGDLQGFHGVFRHGLNPGLRIETWGTRACGFDEEDFLAGVVDGDVLVGLEEAQFADAFGADAAGGEVGDAAGIEFDADVGDVGFGREDGQADGANFADG